MRTEKTRRVRREDGKEEKDSEGGVILILLLT